MLLWLFLIRGRLKVNKQISKKQKQLSGVPCTSVSWPKRLESSPDTHINIRYLTDCTINPSNQKTILLCQSNSYDMITDCSSITHARCKFPCQCTVKNITDVIIGRKKPAHTDSICDLDFQVQKWEMSEVNMNTASLSSSFSGYVRVCACTSKKGYKWEPAPREYSICSLFSQTNVSLYQSE